MKWNKLFLILITVIFGLLSSFASAEVLVLNMNSAEYSAGESAKVFGSVMDNSYNGQNGVAFSLYFDGMLNFTNVTNSDGYYEHYIANLPTGDHNVTVNTSSSNQILTFSVVEASAYPTYQIISSALSVPLSNPQLNFTVKKYLGSTLSSDNFTYYIYYQNGTLYSSSTGTSNVATLVTLPSVVGTYNVIIDGEKSFAVIVKQFTLKFKITNAGGDMKDVFKPNGIAYFEVEGFSNGQKLTNATVSARVTDPTGQKKTVTFVDYSGTYKGNTNVTQTTSIQLKAGDYEVEFIMKDASNNEQKIKGFFKVLGLNVNVNLVQKKPYQTDESAQFDITVKNLADGTLIDHDDITYFLELEENGKFYAISEITKQQSSDSTKTSRFTFQIPASLVDGEYFLRVKATANGKSGTSSSYFEIMNTELFIDLTDNFGSFRNQFKPGELAKIDIESNTNISTVTLQIINQNGVVQSTTNKTLNALEGFLSFNVPSTQGEYQAKIILTTSSGDQFTKIKWFKVQNYFSFLDVKNLDNNFQFIQTIGSSFLGQINVFDVTSGQAVDLSNFVVKFNKIVNAETNQEYTNMQATLNTTFSDATTGVLVYLIQPPTLTNGIYRIEYTIVNSAGKSFAGEGWFGISAFDVQVQTYDSNGQQKSVFSSGESINVSVTLSNTDNGTATLHREFYEELEFNIVNGAGSVVLSQAATNTNMRLPSEGGFYGFGMDVENTAGDIGLGGGFFEIRNLNFRSVTVRSNGKFAAGEDIIADIVMEKSGDLINGTNITLARVVRNKDWADVTSSITDTGAALSDSVGQTTVTLSQTANLEPGYYFVELKATQGTSVVFDGFGFEITQDKVIITINDADKKFSQTDSIEINIKVTESDDTIKPNVTVNLTGLLNLNTWAPVAASKQATTASNGVATITLSAANYNSGKYAPIIRISSVEKDVVGFGNGEFEIKPFDTTIAFTNGEETFDSGESILVNVSVTGTITVTATVEDNAGTVQTVDYFYSNGLFTLNNNFESGDYFLDLTITQNSKSITKTLWFQVIAPWMHIEPLFDPNYQTTDSIPINYTAFTFSANGWSLTNASVNITSIENSWTGNTQAYVGENFSADGSGIYSFDLTPYNLSDGDYILNFELLENDEYDNSLYFRIDSNVYIFVNPKTSSDSNNVTLNFSTSLSSNANYYLEGYTNYQTFTYTTTNGTQIRATGDNVEFNINNLENGFYEANVRIEDGGNTYYWNAFFEIRVKDVTIDAPETASVGERVQFNITATGLASDTYFWIIDPFTQTVLLKEDITTGAFFSSNYTFNYNGFFVYGFGDTKWEMFPNSEQIQVIQAGFIVEWPWNDNRYVLTENRNFTFNVTSDQENNSLTLKFKNHFTGNTITKTDLTTHITANTKKTFTYSLSNLGLTNGPHDVILTLEDGSTQKPRENFFIDIFPDNYDVWAWAEQWEYQAGETAMINIEAHNISDNWNSVTPDSVTLHKLLDPFWTDVSDKASRFSTTSNKVNITTVGLLTGNYHVELNITIAGTSRIQPLDFFVRGNDNLELFWNQNKWDYSSSEDYVLTVNAKDKGVGVADVPASLSAFEKWSESWNEPPTSVNITGCYNFTPENKTGSSGQVIFTLDIGCASLETGGYTGRLNVGGQIVWFDFQVRTYQVDSYTSEWEYGITDTIEVNVRTRDMTTWNPIAENGTVNITRILKHEPGFWQPDEVNLSAFGITSTIFTIQEGEVLIELAPNQTALALDKAYEFEVEMVTTLDTSGVSKGWAWFRLSNGTKPAVTIVDGTGVEPDVIFPDQTYTLQVTGVTSATLKNIWGPNSQSYNEPLVDTGSSLEYNFTTPSFPGWYTMEIEIIRSEGFSEYLYEDFTIGSGTEMNIFMMGGTNNVVPEINFTVVVELFGEGDDPWCSDCQGTWFGPLANKTVTLTGVKDLETFTLIDKTALNISVKTVEFPSWMIPNSGGEGDCMSYVDNATCSQEDSCVWYFDPLMGQSGEYTCDSMGPFCSAINNESICTSSGCSWDGICIYNEPPESSGGGSGGGGEMMEPGEMPGMASFNLHPTILNLTTGKKYDLIFEYIDDENESFEGTAFIQVEQFHVAISKNENDLKANTPQWGWLKASDLYGVGLVNCTITFDGIYNEKDYQLAKSLSINQLTNENGSATFQYTTPSLPGYYLVEGNAICEVDGQNVTQELSYFMEVGAKALTVDMKTKFLPDENVKIVIETKNNYGNPTAQDMDLFLFHEVDNYAGTISTEAGVDCLPAVANAFDTWSNANNMQISTDSTGVLMLELCPLPAGEYEVEIFPIMNFMQGPMEHGEDDFGYFSTFVVGVGNVDLSTTDYKYAVGSTVTVNVNVTDELGQPINGSITWIDSFQESFDSWSEIVIHENDTINISLVDGFATYSFEIPVNGTDEDTGNLTPIGIGPAEVFVRILGDDGTVYTKFAMSFAIVNDLTSDISTDSVVGVNELIDVHAETANDARYKAQMGVFFLKDNPDTEKMWFIDGGGVFFENSTNMSVANFKILSPNEPGDYFLGMPIYELAISPKSIQEAYDLVLTPITVKLETVNVSGTVVYHTDGSGVSGALVQIGKAETFTAADGTFTLEVAKGNKQIFIEKKISNTRYYLKSKQKYPFNTNVDELNVTLYRLEVAGSIYPAVVQINQSTNLSTTYLNVTLDINNSLSNSVALLYTNVSAQASSTIDTLVNLSTAASSTNLLVYPENLTGNYKVYTNVKNTFLNDGTYLVANGAQINNTIGTKVEIDYEVNSSLSSGQNFSGYCGDGFCEYSEVGACSIDCSGVTEICGDNSVDGSEWCDGTDLDNKNCTDFGFNNGTLGCFGDCHGWDFSGCMWSGGGGPMTAPPELDIISTSTSNNATHFVFEFTLNDLNASPMCGGGNLQNDEYEYWELGINSIDSFGCNISDCWSGVDYSIFLEMNWTGDTVEVSEYWNGSSLEEGSLTVTSDYNCGTDIVTLTVPLSEINVSECQNVSLRYDTSFDNGFNEDMWAEAPEIYLININCSSVNQSGNQSLSDINVSVWKTTSSPTVMNGSLAQFFINITNHGINLSNYSVIDSYDGNRLSFLNQSSIPYTYYNVSSSEIVWVVSLATDESLFIRLNFTTIDVGNATNTAEFQNFSGAIIDSDSATVEILPLGGGPATVSLSGYRFTESGSPLTAEGEICLQYQGLNGTCYATNQSYYEFIDLTPGVYFISAQMNFNFINASHASHFIELNYNITTDTEMNFTLWNESLEMISLTNPNQSFTLNGSDYLNLTISDSWNNYTNYSLSVEFEQGSELQTYLVYNQTLSISTSENKTIDAGTYNLSSSTFSAGLIDVFIFYWHNTDTVVKTDIDGVLFATSLLEFPYSNRVIS